MLTYRCGNTTVEGTPAEVAEFFMLVTGPAPAPSVLLPQEITEKVEEGAKFLDQSYTGWHNKVNSAGMANLDPSDPDKCILAMVYGNYAKGCIALREHFDTDVVEDFGNTAEIDGDKVNPFTPAPGIAILVAEAWKNAVVARIKWDRAGL